MTSARVCPFCGGCGEVQKGIYDDRASYSILNGEREPCRLCDGRGYIVIVDRCRRQNYPESGGQVDVRPV